MAGQRGDPSLELAVSPAAVAALELLPEVDPVRGLQGGLWLPHSTGFAGQAAARSTQTTPRIAFALVLKGLP